MTLTYIFAWLIAAAPVLALAIYSMEVAVGLKEDVPPPASDQSPGTVAILIPAHNEAAGIAATVARMQALLPEGGRLLVVADNCEDQTATLARSAGADVAERSDPHRRGKGYALSFGRDVLASNPPDTVIVVDADAHMAPGSVGHLCRVTHTGVPAQAANLLIPDRSAPALVQISNFAFVIKNLVRSRALGRIGRCALLTGSGMAFPWAVFASAPLASGDIAEDLGLGIALTRVSKSAKLVEQAVVLSQAASFEASAMQRQRWEHGFLINAMRHALPTLWDGLRQGSRSMIALGLHLLVPPLALLMIVSAGVLLALIGLAFISGVWLPAVALAAILAIAVGLTILAWIRVGRETLRLTALLQVPLYVVWKIPLYARFLFHRETRWNRTRRDGDA